ncbi:thiamine biosynthesis protein ThiI [Bacillus coahuilensis m2-6]|uniref:Probable tRNA sulfurtransferase n=1 Tax=Bacillus coahuilensis p1.1.43 TaxID=1150625 RepID=A0A147K6K2_9BACI|nr:tRNA uracil 4-sulfurtransferase ThiI [Bacillus coahuilensis]KUP05497.1 thiamine biosynthesis protein ThiI [Bacillus coahuilensis p1.1.43]KUP06686.1 thiamine biosynthesis protein ThiI [Bacillus coahuilensis m2-6]
MKFNRILVRYGEISTKGRNRSQFTSRLRRNVLGVVSDMPKIKVEATRDRMHVYLNDEDGEEVMKRLKTVFGIQSFSPVVKCNKEKDEIQKTALDMMKKVATNKTFKVTVKRADKSFPYDTNELNHMIGGFVLKHTEGLHVDVKNPDYTLQIEIREEGVYLSNEKINGAGGMPAGASGKAMLMLSGGLDSPVAGYLTMKRGVEIEAVHFHSPPYTSERSKEKVIELARILSGFSGTIKLHIVPFTEVQQTIHQQVPENYTMTSTRRMMLKITDLIRAKENGLAIVTGESLGQVASQTLHSMSAINAVTSTPVLRPLISNDKTDIIDSAKEIGTYDTSILPFEDCCTIFTPPAPKTRPKLEKIEYYESFVDFNELIEKAVNNVETIMLNPQSKGNHQEFEELL